MSISLHTYIASIVSQITQSRADADHTAAQIAKIYAQDELLKTFSTPRFRTPEIELTIPIAIDGLVPKPAQSYEPVNKQKFNQKTYQLLKESAANQPFNRGVSIKLQSMIAAESSALVTNLQAGMSKNQALNRYGESAAKNLAAVAKDNGIKTRPLVVEQLVAKLGKHVQEPVKPINLVDTSVVVEAAKLREINPQNMIQIKIKLNEEGMEWHSNVDANGDERARLLPE